jgi:hypothetical protein
LAALANQPPATFLDDHTAANGFRFYALEETAVDALKHAVLGDASCPDFRRLQSDSAVEDVPFTRVQSARVATFNRCLRGHGSAALVASARNGKE